MSSLALSVHVPRRPVSSVALVLHGGTQVSDETVRPWTNAALRMLPFAWSLRRRGGHTGLAVAVLRYRVRGWNEPQRLPVEDAREALAELDRRFPGTRVALIGHSMGGRVALHVADHPTVTTVVALAPWIEQDTPALPAGRSLLIVHGLNDPVTWPSKASAYADRVGATFVGLKHEGHSMLKRARLWHDLTTRFVLGEKVPAQTL